MVHLPFTVFQGPANWQQHANHHQPQGVGVENYQFPQQPPLTAGGDSGTGPIRPSSVGERAVRGKQLKEAATINCPRCDSTNTRFCYFSNYKLSQPRHFCKTCRRYWTKGGALRNVPVGGAGRIKKKMTGSSSNSQGQALDCHMMNPQAQQHAAEVAGINFNLDTYLDQSTGLSSFVEGDDSDFDAILAEVGGNNFNLDTYLDQSTGLSSFFEGAISEPQNYSHFGQQAALEENDQRLKMARNSLGVMNNSENGPYYYNDWTHINDNVWNDLSALAPPAGVINNSENGQYYNNWTNINDNAWNDLSALPPPPPPPPPSSLS